MKFCELLSDQGRSESGQHVSSGYNSVAQRHDFESALRVIKKGAFLSASIILWHPAKTVLLLSFFLQDPVSYGLPNLTT